MSRIALLLVLLLLARPAMGQEPVAYEEGLFELGLPGAAPVTVVTLVDPEGRVLVPLRPVLQQAGIPMTSRGDTLTLEWPPGEWRTVIEAASGVVRRAGGEDSLAPVEWAWLAPELYLSPEALTLLLEAEVRVSWPDLALVVAANPDFPAVRRREIEARRALVQGEDPRFRDVDHGPAYPARTGGAAFSYGASLLHAGGNALGSGRGAIGGAVLGGSLEGGGTLTFGEGLPTRGGDSYVRFARGFPENPWLRQLQAGSVFTDGPLGRRIHGVTVTNAPFTTPRIFGEALLEPTVPAGWEYEVYHGGTLVGIGGREGAEGVRTPLNYGNTPVRVRMIGPAGQEIVEEMVFVVRPEHVPAGRWRHFAGFGRCVDGGCDRYGYGEVRHGLSNRVTAGLGVEHLATEEWDRWRPYGYLGLRPRQNLITDVQLQPGAFLRSNVQLYTPRRGSVGASYAWYRPAGAPEAEGWHAQVSASAPLELLDGRFLSARLLLRGSDPSETNLWQASVSTSVRRTYATLELESGLQRSDVLTLRTYTTLPFAPSPWLRDAALAVSAGASGGGAELLELGWSLRPLENATISTGVRLRRGSGATFTLSFVARFSPGYVQGRAVEGREGGSYFTSATGGMAWGPSAGPMLLPFESVGRGGISGTVFYDHAGDGELGPEDEPVRDAVVVVDGHRVRTDAHGRYRAWHVEPYEAVAVAVDSLTVDYSWVPAVPATFVRASPNVFTQVDLPLVRTREVVGRVEAAPEEFRTTGGILIELRSPEGALVDTARTFSDGEFYLPRVSPGRYQIGISPASLAALGGDASPGSQLFEVDVSGTAPVEVPAFRLLPR